MGNLILWTKFTNLHNLKIYFYNELRKFSIYIVQMKGRGTGVCSSPPDTKCLLVCVNNEKNRPPHIYLNWTGIGDESSLMI